MKYVGHFRGEEKRGFFPCQEIGEDTGCRFPCEEVRANPDCHMPCQEKEVNAYCQFTLVVDARTLEEATEKFADEIFRIRQEEDVFDNLEDIFVGHVRRFIRWPERAIMTNYSSVAPVGEGWNVFTYMAEEEGTEIVVHVPDDVNGEEAQDAWHEGRCGELPFIRFEPNLNDDDDDEYWEGSSNTVDRPSSRHQGRPLRKPWQKGKLWEGRR